MEIPNKDSAAGTASSSPKNQQRSTDRKPRVPLSCGPCRNRKLKCNRERPCQKCAVRGDLAACAYTGTNRDSVLTRRHEHVGNMQQRIDRLESLITRIASQNHVEREKIPDSEYVVLVCARLLHVYLRYLQQEEVLSQIPDLGSTNNDSVVTQQSEPIASPNPHKTRPAKSTGLPIHDISTIGDGSESRNKVAAYEHIQHGMGVMKITDDCLEYRGSSHWDDVFHELNELKNVWTRVQTEDENISSHDENSNSSTAFTSAMNGPSLLCGFIRSMRKEDLLQTLPAKPAVDKLILRFFNERDTPLPSLHILHKPTFMKQYENHWPDPSRTKSMWLGLLFSMLSLAMLSYHLGGNEPPEYEGLSLSLFELYRTRTAQCLLLADMTKGSPNTIETLLFHVISEYSRRINNAKSVWIMVGIIVRIALQMGYHRDPSNFGNISVFQGEIRRRVWCFVQGLDAITSFTAGLPSMLRSVDQDTAEPRSLYDWELNESVTELPPPRPCSEVTPVSYMIAKRHILRPLGDIVEFVSSLQPYSYDTVLNLDGELSKARLGVPPRLQMKFTPKSADEPPSLLTQRSSLDFLYHQGMCILHRNFLVRGRLDTQADVRHWNRISFTSHEFIVPAMILCLDLRHGLNQGLHEDNTGPAMTQEYQNDVVLQSLKISRDIWKEAQTSSPEAAKVHRILSHMLSLLDIDAKPQATLQRFPEVESGPTETVPNYNDILFMGSARAASIQDLEMDWGAWDSFIEDSNFEDVYAVISGPRVGSSID